VGAAPAFDVPAAVEKVTIAVEAWGSDSLNPVHAKTVNFLWANFLPFLVSRDEQYNIVPALATSWEGSPEGWSFTLDPEAIWEDGASITAEDVKFSFEATMGMHDFIGATPGGRMKRSIETIEVGTSTRYSSKPRPRPRTSSSTTVVRGTWALASSRNIIC
jgi:peptide/nickel transport system substrate-binding protein